MSLRPKQALVIVHVAVALALSTSAAEPSCPWVWTTQGGTGNESVARAVAVNGEGEIVVAGDAAGEGRYDVDVFVTKLAPDGTRLWTHRHGNETTKDKVEALALNRGGEIFLAGWQAELFGGVMVMFVRKLSAGGIHLWAWQGRTGQDSIIRALAVDSSGDIIAAGFSQSDDGDNKLVAMKISMEGTLQWTHKYGSADGKMTAEAMALNPADDILVAGWVFGDSIDGDAGFGGTDAHVSKIFANGAWEWTRRIGTGGSDRATALAWSPEGEIFVAGWTEGSLQNPAEFTLSSHDIFVVKFTPDGSRLWTWQEGSAGKYDETQARALVVNSAGHVVVAGSTPGSFAGHKHMGSNDLILVELSPDGAPLWTEQRGSDMIDFPQAMALNSAEDIFIVGCMPSDVFFVMKFSWPMPGSSNATCVQPTTTSSTTTVMSSRCRRPVSSSAAAAAALVSIFIYAPGMP